MVKVSLKYQGMRERYGCPQAGSQVMYGPLEMWSTGFGVVALLMSWYPVDLVVIAVLHLESVSPRYIRSDSYIRRARCANRSCICFLFFASRTFFHSSSLGSVLRTIVYYLAAFKVAGITFLHNCRVEQTLTRMVL